MSIDPELPCRNPELPNHLQTPPTPTNKWSHSNIRRTTSKHPPIPSGRTKVGPQRSVTPSMNPELPNHLQTPTGNHPQTTTSKHPPSSHQTQVVAQKAGRSVQKSTHKKRGVPGPSPGDAPRKSHWHQKQFTRPRTRKLPNHHPQTPTPHTLRGGRSNKSSRTRDESQRIAGQAYSHAYNTPFKSSRLQGIPVGHTVPFHSSAAPRPTSGPQRIQHPSHDPDTSEDASIVKSNHAADYISSIYSARLPA